MTDATSDFPVPRHLDVTTNYIPAVTQPSVTGDDSRSDNERIRILRHQTPAPSPTDADVRIVTADAAAVLRHVWQSGPKTLTQPNEED